MNINKLEQECTKNETYFSVNVHNINTPPSVMIPIVNWIKVQHLEVGRLKVWSGALDNSV